MSYIRSKLVKGIEYSYLVKSQWDSEKNTSRQITIKYLGKTSNVKNSDIPVEHRNNPHIIKFFKKNSLKGQSEIYKIQNQLEKTLLAGNKKDVKELFLTNIEIFGLADFYDNVLCPVLQNIGEEVDYGKITQSDSYVASKIVQDVIKTITEKMPNKKNAVVLVCVPYGEIHCLGSMMLESVLTERGFDVVSLPSFSSTSEILSLIEEKKPVSILISATQQELLESCRKLVDSIRSSYSVPVFLGGSAFEASHEKIDANLIKPSTLSGISKMIRKNPRIFSTAHLLVQ